METIASIMFWRTFDAIIVVNIFTVILFPVITHVICVNVIRHTSIVFTFD